MVSGSFGISSPSSSVFILLFVFYSCFNVVSSGQSFVWDSILAWYSCFLTLFCAVPIVGIWLCHHFDVQPFMCKGMTERKAVQLMMLTARHFILAMKLRTRKKKLNWQNDWYVWDLSKSLLSVICGFHFGSLCLLFPKTIEYPVMIFRPYRLLSCGLFWRCDFCLVNL